MEAVVALQPLVAGRSSTSALLQGAKRDSGWHEKGTSSPWARRLARSRGAVVQHGVLCPLVVREDPGSRMIAWLAEALNGGIADYTCHVQGDEGV